MAEQKYPSILDYFDVKSPYFGVPEKRNPYVQISLISRKDVLKMYKYVMNLELEPIWLEAAADFGEYVVVPYYWFYYLLKGH